MSTVTNRLEVGGCVRLQKTIPLKLTNTMVVVRPGTSEHLYHEHHRRVHQWRQRDQYQPGKRVGKYGVMGGEHEMAPSTEH